MTNDELCVLADSVAAGRIPAREAILRLVAAGHDKDEATELVFFALGGSDLILVDADGTERYEESGLTVAEVAKKMRR